MRIVTKSEDMQRLSIEYKRQGKTVGFVPTMGYLHEGHTSLINIAHKYADVVVVSIFVNPIQFGPSEDYDRYPRDIERDKEILEKMGVDVMFYPSVDDMYPKGFTTYVEVKGLSDKLCGRYRPGHFRGVTTVVAKLFNIVMPDVAVFGEKDAQQAIIIKRMVRDLNFPVKIIVGPTVREPDGLAMSSRNEYLTEEERKVAPAIYQSLLLAKGLVEQGERDTSKIIAAMQEFLSKYDRIKVEYIEIVDKEELNPIERLEKGEALIAIAAYLGKARLIDNISVKVGGDNG
ncbi:pantoate--beta-alanine ligase [candidate division WOR-3 bacterium]|nr:pantoate--beta-alanine ligase [candidate division WOR-3 bacterium]